MILMDGQVSKMEICYTPIGYFRTPFHTLEDMPIQPSNGECIKGTIEISLEYIEGLRDLDGFSHIIILSHLHQSKGFQLTVTPFLDTVQHGVFATRAPRRPNSIGFSVMRLESIAGNVLTVEGVDVLDGTPVLDIKPYVTEFDSFAADRLGWLAGKADLAQHHRSDRRFSIT